MTVSPTQTTQADPQTRLQARYGGAQNWTPPEWNSTLEVLLRHRSVRRWLPREISEDTVRTIVAAAQSGSTSSNRQIISVVAVRDPGKRRALAQVGGPNQRHIAEAPTVLVWLIDFSRAQLLAQKENADTGVLDYLDEALVGATDVGISGQNAVTAAESLGLGAVFLGSLRNDVERVAEILGTPENVVPFLGLEIGHPDPAEAAGIKPRLPQEAVLHWDTYDAGAAEQHIDDYDEALGRYYADLGQQHTWSRRVIERLSTPVATATRRHLVRRVFERAGFGLR